MKFRFGAKAENFLTHPSHFFFEGGKMKIDIDELLEISDMNSLMFRVEPPIDIRYFENLLKSDNWEKDFDEREYEGYGNFIVIYKKGTYEITLFCDVDGYVFKFEITKIQNDIA